MKKVFMGLVVIASLLACDDSDDSSNRNNSAKITEVKNTSVAGQWRITYFFDTDSDETNHFTGYIFEFDSSNNLTATNGSNNYAGTWSVANSSNSGDDNSDFDDIDFNIAFTNPPNFEELSEDWEILSMTANKIELRHVSGGNGGTDLLTFEKV